MRSNGEGANQLENGFKSAIGNWKSAMILSGWETVFFWIFSLAAILAGS